MQLTKGAIGNLINRYKAVLKKCHLLNTFGSLAVASMLVMSGAGLAGATDIGSSTVTFDKSYTEDINIKGAYDIGVYASGATADFSGKQLNIATTPGTGWGSGNVGVYAASTTAPNSRSVINFGQAGTTESISIDVQDTAAKEDIAIGVWAKGDPGKTGGLVNLNADTVTIKASSQNGWVYGLYAQNATTSSDKDLATININAGKTYIDVTSGQPGRATAIVAMSQGIINIDSDLYVNTQGGDSSAIVARGDAAVTINKDGTHTVQMNGDIDFNYDGSTSGTKVDADIDITLSGVDSWWNGNTLISWNGTPSDASKLTVSGMTLTLKDGATWTPTAITGTESHKYASLNNLILDNGNINVKEGVEIAIDQVAGTGFLDNKGTVTLTSGKLDGGTSNSGIINLDPGAAISNVTFEKGTQPADKGLIVVDTTGRVVLNGGMATGEESAAFAGNIANNAEDVSISNTHVNNSNFAPQYTTDSKSRAAAIVADLQDKDLVISNSSFENNATYADNGTGYVFADGAAVSVMGDENSSLTIKDSVFNNNSYNESWNGVNGPSGGAIGAQRVDVVLDNLTLTANKATNSSTYVGNDGIGMAQGGAYYQSTGKLDARHITAVSNVVSSPVSAMGGAMALFGITGGQLSDSVFSENKAESKESALGGALYLSGAQWGDPALVFKITSTAFSSNSAISTDGSSSGGALMVKGGSGDLPGVELSIENTTFNANIADGHTGSKGGAIIISNSGNTDDAVVTISDSIFTNNQAKGDNGKGGAIYNAGTLTLTGDNLFSGNTAAEGKDIYNTGALAFTGTNTQMDGGMVMADGTMSIDNSQVNMAELDARAGNITVTGSELSVSKLTGNTLGSSLTVGTDGIVNIGNLDTTKLGEVMNDAGMGSGSAVLALNTSVTLDNNARLVVGKDASQNTATAVFGENSLLVVDAEGVTGNQVIHADGDDSKTAFIHSGAQLRIINAVAGEYVTVLNGFDTIMNEHDELKAGWTNNEGVENLDYMLSSYATIMEGPDGQPDVVVVSELNDPTEALPGIDPDLAPVLNEVWGNKLNDVDSPDMGVRFLSRAARADYIKGDAAKSAATIESAARIAFAGAVPQMTKMASDAATNAVVNRLGFADPADGAQAMNAEGQIVDRNTTGFALWIAPLWQSQHGWGMEAGNLDYGFNGNLGGVSLGADYTFENAIRAGITFNIGGGYAETSGGDLNSTQNNMNFWGLGAYAGWNYENFAVMADVSYTSTWNQLEQDLDPGMGMGDLEADVQATAISAGLRAEYKLETSVLDVIPHVGVRYMSLNTWGYDVDARDGTVMEGDGFHQDIWTFPVGVTFSKDFTLDSGWFFKPSLDFSVIPAAGDIKAKEDVRFTGAPAVAEMETQMMDYLTWQGGVGLEMGNDTMSFGVNYTLQAGQHTTGHGVFGSFRYEF